MIRSSIEAARREAEAAVKAAVEAGEEVHFMEALLVLVDKEAMARLAAARSALEAAAGAGERRGAFWHLASLVNPDRPARRYSLYRAHQYRLVADRAKVAERMPKLLRIWANKLRKETEAAILEYGYTEIEAARARDEVSQRIREAEEEVLEILADPSKWELVDTNLDRAKEYPFVYAHFSPGSRCRLLRAGMPNFLWLESEDRRLGRAKRRLQGMRNLFGDIYVKPKGGE